MKGAGVPVEWVLSRICEEFGCLPSQAREELTTEIFTIMELRGYARAKDLIERLETDEAESEELLARAGISEELSASVMGNIAWAAGLKHDE